jgi:hypothetical protein
LGFEGVVTKNGMTFRAQDMADRFGNGMCGGLRMVGPEVHLEKDVMPLKNPACPHYENCLDRAVSAKWPQFTCSNCVFRDLRVGIEPDSREMDGYYRLLQKIFEIK